MLLFVMRLTLFCHVFSVCVCGGVAMILSLFAPVLILVYVLFAVVISRRFIYLDQGDVKLKKIRVK